MKPSAFDPAHQNGSAESKIIAALERIAQAFRVLLWQESKAFSLSPIQVQTLIFLHYHSAGKRKVGYLADEFNMTKATISEVVKTLEQKKLIRREYEPSDTRSYRIHLTPEGMQMADKTSCFTRQLQTPIDQLAAPDKEMLLLSLMDIIYALNQSGLITIQRMCRTCSYYRQPEGSHYCTLLQKPLAATMLRLDCPEHQPAAKAG